MTGGFRDRKKKRKGKRPQLENGKEYVDSRQRKNDPEPDPLLYICTFEAYKRDEIAPPFRAGYHVYTIRVSDLYKPSPDKVKEVASLQGEHLPLHMGFAVFGSRIVLAGGWFLHPRSKPPSPPTYVFETDSTEEPNPSFISTDTCTSTRPRYMIPQLKGHQKHRIWIREIEGKLYAISGTHSGKINFQEYDPKAESIWNPLPPPPFVGYEWGKVSSYSACVLVGTKIILIAMMVTERFKTICFDVAHPKRSWTGFEDLCFDPLCVSSGLFKPVLVLDVQKDQDGFDTLIFTFDISDSQILVSRMKLSNGGVPVSVELVAALGLPGCCNIEPSSYNCVHLGGQTVCFAFLDVFTLHVITFSFTYAPFSHKFLGHMLNKFNTAEKLSSMDIGGCFTL